MRAPHQESLETELAPSFERFAAEVLSLNRPPIRAKGTHRQMSQVLREFGALPYPLTHALFAGKEGVAEMRDSLRSASVAPLVASVADLRSATIADWIHAYPDRTGARTASLLRSLSSACSYAVSEGYLRTSPFSWRKVNEWARDVVVAPDRPQAQRHQSAESILRFLELLDVEASEGSWKAGRLQALGYLLAYTGVRKEEALNLKPWDIDLERRTVAIQPRKTFRPKTKKSAATLPLADPLGHILGLWLPRCGGEWVFPGVRLKTAWRSGSPGYKPLDEIRAAGERAGIKGLTIAGFRKTLGTLAKSWGLGQLELKALLRHSTVETQRWYDEEAVESLRGAVEKIKFRVAGA